MKIYQTEIAKVFFGGKNETLSLCEKVNEGPITFGHQVHETELVLVKKNSKASGCLISSSDGLYTKTRNLSLGLVTADCVPCVLATPDKLFSLHLGWRGVCSGLLKKALSFIKKEERLEVFIGPHILYDSFEVQKNLIDKFELLYPSPKNWSKKVGDKFYMSLLELIKYDLNLRHPHHTLYFNGEDTYTNKEYFSYRLDNKTPQRNITFSFLRS